VRQGPASSTAAKTAQRLGLRLVTRDELCIRRRRAGQGWSYLDQDGCPLRHEPTIRRLRRLAVPPAYEDVLFASDPAAHLQAVGRDAAGRLQYRYHPKWEKVREIRKARRLARLAGVLPRIRRSIGRYLGDDACGLAFTCSAVIELIANSAIRPGNESYARLRGTRGAATLLKSNVGTHGSRITLTFRAKGGKTISKQFTCARLAAALDKLSDLPGRRLFQYRGENGAVHAVRTTQVNSFLREIAGTKISLKDFRTLLASASVLESLCAIKPASTERQRRKQVMQAIRQAAAELANTPAICRKSYVHTAIVEAFEDGVLERFADALRRSRSEQSRAEVLSKVLSKV
jgi:DNA topoisomerase-1